MGALGLSKSKALDASVRDARAALSKAQRDGNLGAPSTQRAVEGFVNQGNRALSAYEGSKAAVGSVVGMTASMAAAMAAGVLPVEGVIAKVAMVGAGAVGNVAGHAAISGGDYTPGQAKMDVLMGAAMSGGMVGGKALASAAIGKRVTSGIASKVAESGGMLGGMALGMKAVPMGPMAPMAGMPSMKMPHAASPSPAAPETAAMPPMPGMGNIP